MRRLGRYVVVEEVGRGAMGVVYKAVHPAFAIPVAIKVLNGERARDTAHRQRMLREARALASLDHPGVARVYDLDRDGDVLFLVMELIEGRSLRSMVLERGRLDAPLAVEVMLQVLEAVGAAHDRGIIHRDLKPDNVMITEAAEVKVVDFGVSRLLGDLSRVTASGITVGTPYYMAPEQLRAEETDGRTDIYALGVMLYELLTGHPPFAGTTAHVLRAQFEDPPPASELVPEPLMQVIETAMAKERQARFADASEFARALRAARASLAAPAPATPRDTTRRRRAAGAALLTTVAAVMLMVTTAVAAVTVGGGAAAGSPALSAARAYLDGLATGNAAEAWSAVAVDESVIPPGAPALLGPDALAAMLRDPANRAARPAAITLTEAGGVELATVSYAGGALRDAALRLVATPAGWRVLLAPAALELPALPPGVVSVDGAPLTAAAGQPAFVLPGFHRVRYQPVPGAPLDPLDVEVAAPDAYPKAVPVALSPTVAAGPAAAALAAVGQRFSECRASPLLRPPGCPQAVSSTLFVSQVAWTLAADPTAGATVAYDLASGLLTVSGSYAMSCSYIEGGQPRRAESGGRYRAAVRWDGTQAAVAGLAALA